MAEQTLNPEALLQAQEAEALRRLETPRELAPAALETAGMGRFVFRSEPGKRQLLIRIPVPTPLADEKKDAYFRARWAKKVPKPERDRLERVVDIVGNYHIRFVPIARHFECVYATDSPEVADFLLDVLEKKPGAGFYLDAGTITLKCEFCAERFPNTEAGRRQLATHTRRQHPQGA